MMFMWSSRPDSLSLYTGDKKKGGGFSLVVDEVFVK
jgi:hypothetical protein